MKYVVIADIKVDTLNNFIEEWNKTFQNKLFLRVANKGRGLPYAIISDNNLDRIISNFKKLGWRKVKELHPIKDRGTFWKDKANLTYSKSSFGPGYLIGYGGHSIEPNEFEN